MWQALIQKCDCGYSKETNGKSMNSCSFKWSNSEILWFGNIDGLWLQKKFDLQTKEGNKNTCFLFVLFIQTTIVFPGWAALGLSAKACGKGRHWQAQTLAIFQYHGLHLDNNDWDVTFTWSWLKNWGANGYQWTRQIDPRFSFWVFQHRTDRKKAQNIQNVESWWIPSGV